MLYPIHIVSLSTEKEKLLKTERLTANRLFSLVHTTLATSVSCFMEE